MKDENKTKEQLIGELIKLRRRNAELDALSVEHNQMEMALRESEERYRALVENANEAILVTQDGMIKFANPKAQELGGYSEDELISRPFVELIHPDDREMVFERYSKRLKGEEVPHVYSYRIIDSDGNTRWLSSSGAMVTWEGKPAALGILTDITEHMRAEEELRKHRDHLEELVQERTEQLQQEIARGRQTEEELRERERRYRDVIALAGGVAYEHGSNAEGIYYFMDEGIQRLTGYSPDEMTPELFRSIVEEAIKYPGKTISTGDDVRLQLDGKEATTYRSDFRIRTADGGIVWLADSSIDIRDANGEIIRSIGMLQDITERKRTEGELRAEKEFSQNILDTVVDTIFVFDPNTGKPIRWNRAFSEISGYTDEEIATMKAPDDWYSEEDLERVGAAGEEVFQKGSTTIEISFVTKDGRRIPTEYTGSIAEHIEGDARYIVAVGRDIRERKQAEDMMRRERDKAQKYLDVAGVMLIVIGTDQRVSLINQRGCDILGYDCEEITGENWFDNFLPARMRDEVKTVFDMLIAGEAEFVEYFENPVLTKNGEERIIAWHNTILTDDEGNIAGTLSSGEDITQRKQAEEKLRESEERFRELTEPLPQVVFETDIKGKFTFLNRHIFTSYGYTQEDFENGMSVRQMLIPEDQARAVENIRKILAGAEIRGTEYTALRKDGSTFPIVIYSTPIIRDGKPVGLRGIVVDIAELKQTEQALRENEEMLRKILESSPDAITVTDLDGNIIECNQATMNLHGFSTKGELIGKSALDLIASQDREKAAINMQRILEQDFVSDVEYTCLTRDGVEFTAELSASVIRDQHGNPASFVAVTKDITKRKQAEEEIRQTNRRLEETLAELEATQQQVIQQERLRALGQLASGIAHDFNNALTPIMGYSELLLGVPGILDDREKTKNYLELMSTAAEDARSIVSRLQEFYRPREEDEVFTSVNLNQLVEEVIQLTQPKWKDQTQANGITISIETDFQEIPMINGNKAELREALTNLIFNAVDAMPTNGTVTLRTRTGDEHAILELSDTGIGMTEEVKQRCFEPFFSTKEETGTGLGLSMVHGIIRRHAGAIQIESEIGKGTTFVIHLPWAKQSDREVKQDVETRPRQLQQLHVLVVDDEPSVQDIMAEYLAVDGHTYEITSNGRQGLSKFREGKFDIVITDRAMPDMGGVQLASLIKLIAPKTPVIMLTGFGDMMQTLGDMPEGVDCVISKPVTLQKFREALAQIGHFI